MAKKSTLVVGNWKMYVTSPDVAKKFTATLRRKSRAFAGVDAALAPSFTLLPTVVAGLKGSTSKVGAQDVSEFTDHARTGEVSGAMLKSAGVQFVIVGHSERRAMGESNDIVRTKLKEVLAQGLTVLLCVGERERDDNGTYLSFIEEQLGSALSGMGPIKPGKLIIAYEPVWAIGKSAQDAMKPAEVREMSIFIKKTLTQHLDRAAALKVPILYGGSVEATNAKALIKEGDVNGLLVGHASAEVESFVAILSSLAK